MYRKINNNKKIFYDIIIIGGGHSGVETINITNRLKIKTLLITENINRISIISCNPSIGGNGKDQLIKELNKLGGLMGKNANLTGTNFQLINNNKRIQIDKILYSINTQKILFNKKISIIENKIKNIIKINKNYNGILTFDNQKLFSKYVVISTGTFINRKILNGLNFIKKENHFNKKFIKNFKYYKKFKTGTPPRLIINNTSLKRIKKYKQIKNIPYIKGVNNKNIKNKFIPYWKIKTSKKTINIIKKYIKYSTRFSGLIKCRGPRYCPSMEDKISRYNKQNHIIFLERESIINKIIYPGGLSLSVPNSIQNIIIQSIKKIKNALIIKHGFNVEYTYLNPKNINKYLEYKKYKNIFFSGQINGTSGYEEAAIQGINVGINIYNKIIKKNIINPYKENKFLKKLINNITNKNIFEPYRIFNYKNNNYKIKKTNINNYKNLLIKNKLLLLLNNLSNENKYIIKKYNNNNIYNTKKINKLFFNKCIHKINNFIKKIYYNE